MSDMRAVIGARLVRLSGTVAHFRKTRARVRFILTQLDPDTASTIAMACSQDSALPKPSGASRHRVEEEADYVEFMLEGRPVKGWVWRSPFGDGDHVDVAAEWHGDHYEAFGIARPRDRAVALYPFCCRGSVSHLRAAFRWWTLFGVAVTWSVMGALFVAAVLFSSAVRPSPSFTATALIVCLAAACTASGFLALLAYSLARRWWPFARTAERVFAAFGWRDPSRVDLIRTTQERRTAADPVALGTFYFRY